jgi:Pyruvate/2-oxoacid:ferredoxin oxidoreductase delta subunit
MKTIQNIGFALFIGCLALFIGVLFGGEYHPNNQILNESISSTEANSQLIRFISAEKPLVSYNKFQLLKNIDSGIKSTNIIITNEKSISLKIVDEIIDDKSEIEFNEALIDNLSLQESQKQKLKDYTSWMNGKTYSSQELETNLQNTINNINGSIISEYGIDDYKVKSLKTDILKATATGFIAENASLLFFVIFIFGAIAGLIYILPNLVLLGGPGIKNNGIVKHPMTSRKWLGILTGSLLIVFYIVLYWFPYYLVEWMIITEPFAHWVSGGGSSQWFVYGLLYTLAVLVMGVRMLIKYRHSKYHLVRTGSVMFFQLAFAFIIPQILAKNSLPAPDLKNMWPLDYSFFFDYRLDQMIEAGTIGYWMLGWGIALFVIGVPAFTYFYGKRWYCSWVCGCGGLAETLGDPYRQLSDKSMKAWKIERWMIHSVLVFAVVMTALVLYTYDTGESTVFGLNSYAVRGWYGFFIGSAFAGVVGTGFYPLMGNRTWCRFGCPLAAYLGIIQRFKSRFRITTNGGQCISCGNCSTYCEQGIDVRAYAQKGENIVRSSCVGCGVCAAVCPRGVLKLENGPEEGRIHGPIEISSKGITVVE